MKYFLLLIFICLSTMQSSLTAQVPSGVYNETGLRTSTFNLDDFSGSIYLEDAFQPGRVYDGLTNKEIDVYLRYDVYQDVFERKPQLNASNHTYLEKALGVVIFYNGRPFELVNFYNSDNVFTTGYLEQIGEIDGRTFYVDYDKNLRMPQKAKTSMQSDIEGKIRDVWFVVIKDDSGTSVRDLTKRNAHEFFAPEKQDAIEKFVKKERLKFKEPKDLRKLTDFASSL